MANFSDNEALFNTELLDLMGTALKDIYSSGGVVKIKKGDFFAEYTSPTQIMSDIKNLKATIHFQANGCVRRCN